MSLLVHPERVGEGKMRKRGTECTRECDEKVLKMRFSCSELGTTSSTIGRKEVTQGRGFEEAADGGSKTTRRR